MTSAESVSLFSNLQFTHWEFKQCSPITVKPQHLDIVSEKVIQLYFNFEKIIKIKYNFMVRNIHLKGFEKKKPPPIAVVLTSLKLFV